LYSAKDYLTKLLEDEEIQKNPKYSFFIWQELMKTDYNEGIFSSNSDLRPSFNISIAKFKLAICYQQGLGCPIDEKAAFHFFELAAEVNIVKGLF